MKFHHTYNHIFGHIITISFGSDNLIRFGGPQIIAVQIGYNVYALGKNW